MPKPKTSQERIGLTVRLPRGLVRRLRQLALDWDQTIQTVVDEALEAYIQQHEKKRR